MNKLQLLSVQAIPYPRVGTAVGFAASFGLSLRSTVHVMQVFFEGLLFGIVSKLLSDPNLMPKS